MEKGEKKESERSPKGHMFRLLLPSMKKKSKLSAKKTKMGRARFLSVQKVGKSRLSKCEPQNRWCRRPMYDLGNELGICVH